MIFHRQEQPKSPPKPPGLAFVAEELCPLPVPCNFGGLGQAGVLVLFGAHSPPTRRRSWFMPRGSARAQLTTDAAILPTLRPLPSIQPKRTRMGDTPPTGRIGSRQQLAGGVPWGCFGGAQRSYGDHLHPIRLRFHGKPLF